MTLIDLGELPASELDRPELPALPTRRLIRPFALALVALLALTTLTTSALPRPQLVRTLWNIQLAETDFEYLDGDTVYLTRVDDDHQVTLTAYDATTGHSRWTVGVGTDAGLPQFVTSVGVILQSAARIAIKVGEGPLIEHTKTTVALDKATGSRLWQLEAVGVHAAGGRVLMQQYDAKGRANRLLMVRLRDGAIIWSRAVKATDAVTTSADSVVAVDDSGTVTVLSWADGTVRGGGKVLWAPMPAGSDVYQRLSVVHGQLIARLGRLGGRSVVYRLDTLAEIWRTTGTVVDCEQLVCSVDSGVIVGRDPTTGTERWRRDVWGQIFPVGVDRLMAGFPATDGSPQLIDTVTGKTVAKLSSGMIAGSEQPNGTPLLLHNLPGSPIHTTVIQIDPTSGKEFVLGTVGWLGDDIAECQATTHVLACPSHDLLTITAVN